MNVSPAERLIDIAIATFLWAFRIAVVLVVVIGTILTLQKGTFTGELPGATPWCTASCA